MVVGHWRSGGCRASEERGLRGAVGEVVIGRQRRGVKGCRRSGGL